MRLRPCLTLPAAALLLVATLITPWLPAADDPTALLNLRGHRENVFSVAYSPDGKLLVTVSGDPSIKIWDAATGKALKTFSESGADGHKKIILSVAVSPDGSQFATASADNTMKLWDMPTSNFIRQIAQPSAPRRVAVSPDGKVVAAGSLDGKVRVWSAEDGKALWELPAGRAAVTGLAFSGNGQTLAALSADGALRYFNVAGKALVAEYAAHPGEGTGLALSPNNNAAFTTGVDGALKSWAFPPTPSKMLLAEPVSDLGMSSDGANFVLASGKTVRLGSSNSGTLKSTFAADVDLTAAAAAGGHVAAATANRDVVVWQAKDAKAVRFAAHDGPVTGVALNQAGNLLATAGKDGLIRVWTLPVAAAKKVDGGGPVSALAALPDGKRFVVGGPDKTVRVMRFDGTAERQLSGHAAGVRAVTVLKDGKAVASAGDDGAIRVWGSKAETVALIGAHPGPVTTLVAVGDRLLSASPDGSVKLWQPVESAGKGTLAHAGAVTSVAVSPDGTRLVTGCDDKQVRLWSMMGDKTERTFGGPSAAVLAVTVNRAGDRVAAGVADKSLFVWEAGSGKEVRKLTGLSGAVKAVGLPADGRTVVVGLTDGSVRSFDLATGKEGKALAGHKGAVNALALPTKGDTVVTAGDDGAVTVQPLAGGAPVTWKAAGPAAAVAVRPDGAMIAVATGKSVQLFTPAGKLLATVTTPANVRGVAYSFDGKRLAAACDDNLARVYGADGGLEETLVHDAAVNAVAFSTDGRRLVSVSADKTARHRPLSLVWQARPGAVADAAVSPRGDRVLAACEDGAVHSFALADGKPMGKFEAHKKARRVAISADAARVVTVGDDEARIWDGAKLLKAIALKAEPSALALSPDGKRLAVAVPGPKPGTNLVRLFDTASGAGLLTLGEAEPLSAAVLAWDKDNRTLTVAGVDRAVRQFDVNVGAAFEAHPGGVAGLTFNPAGQILTAGADKAVRLWSTAGKMEKEVGKLPQAATALAGSFDGAMVAATAGNRVVAWTVNDGKEVAAFDSPAALGAVGFNSDRTRLAVAAADGRAIVYDLGPKREAQAFLHGGAVTALAWSRTQPAQLFAAGADKKLELHTVGLSRQVVHDRPLRALAMAGNGAYVVVGGEDGLARRYNASGGNLEKGYEPAGKAVTAVALTKNEATAAVASADGALRLFGSADGKLVATLTLPAPARSLAFTPDGKALVCALSNGAIEGRDVAYAPGGMLPEGFGQVQQGYAHGAEGGAVAFPSAGTMFWSAGGDGALKAWKLASESPVRSFTHPNTVNAVAYTPDGTRAVTGCSDGKLRVFDLSKGAQLKQVDAHLTKDLTSIYGVAVTRDGKRSATAGQDGAVKVFEVETGKLVREIKAFKEKESPKGHTDSVLCVAFSPDGNQVATGGMDQAIKVWGVNDGALVREFANPAIKGVAHPGWVYALRWTADGRHVVSVGQAPRLRGYVAVWEAGTGKLLSGRELSVGTIYGVALSPDEKAMAIGTGGSVRSGTHLGIVLPVPGR